MDYKKEYLQAVRLILESTKKEKELIETICRMRGIIEQQQGSTETINTRVGEYLDMVDATYMQSGIMDAINRGLFNSKIVPLS